MSWVSPTGYNDPDSKWVEEPKVYDEDQATFAYTSPTIAPDSWSGFLELTISSITCNKVRFDAYYTAGYIDAIDLDVYKDDEWIHVYQGAFSNHTWVEKTFAVGTVTKARARFYNNFDSPLQENFYEFDFWSLPVAHEKTLTENFGFLDKVPKGVTLHSLTENLGLADKTVKVSSLMKSELLGLTDNYSRLWTVQRTYSELFGLTDSLEAYRQLIKMLVESLGLLDSYGRLWTIEREYSELLGFLDLTVKDITLHPLSESFGLLDSLEAMKQLIASLTEILGLSDSYSRVWESHKIHSEFLGLKDSLKKETTLHPFSELLGLSDFVEKQGVKNLKEFFGLKDSMVKSTEITRTELLDLADFLKNYFPGITIINSLLSILERGMILETEEIKQKLEILEREMKLKVEPK